MLSVTYEGKVYMTTKRVPQWTASTIKAIRVQLELTQAQFAEKLGCRQQTISEWELGLYTPKNAYQRLLTQLFGGLYAES